MEGIMIYLNNSNKKIFGVEESEIGKVYVADFLTEKSLEIYQNIIECDVKFPKSFDK